MQNGQDKKDVLPFFDRNIPSVPSDLQLSSLEGVILFQKAYIDFCQDVESQDCVRICRGYGALREAFVEHIRAEQPSDTSCVYDIGFLQNTPFSRAAKIIYKDARRNSRLTHACFATMHRMYCDKDDLFGLKHSNADLGVHLATYCLRHTSYSGKYDPVLAKYDPVHIFQHMKDRNPHWQPLSNEWGIVAEFLGKTDQYDRICELHEQIDKLRVDLTPTGQAIFVSLHLKFNNIQRADRYLQDIERQGGQLPMKVLVAAVDGFCRLLRAGHEQAATIKDRLIHYTQQLQSLTSSSGPDPPTTAARRAVMTSTFTLHGPKHVLQNHERQGSDHDVVFMINHMLRLQAGKLKLLETSDDALSLLNQVLVSLSAAMSDANDITYRTLMLALLDQGYVYPPSVEQSSDLPTESSPNKIRETQMLYDRLRSIGVFLGYKAVAPLLRAYCQAFVPSLSDAVKLVDNLLEDLRARPSSSLSGEDSQNVGTSIVFLINHACVRLRDPGPALQVISRLQQAGLTLWETAKPEIIRQLLPAAVTWREAFAIYQSVSLSHLGKGAGFDPGKGAAFEAYVSIIEQFRQLSCVDDKRSNNTKSDTQSPAPPEYLLAIVKDMQQAGCKVPNFLFVNILVHYSKRTNPSYEGVQATHDLLKNDANFEPDNRVVTALMMAYSRVGEPSVVFAIWDRLVATNHPVESHTLSVIFDTYGRYGRLHDARATFALARRMDAERLASGSTSQRAILMNKDAWDSYLECLARCGQLREAVDLLFGDMRRSLLEDAVVTDDLAGVSKNTSLDDLLVRQKTKPLLTRGGKLVGPDEKSFGVMLKFAARDSKLYQGRAFKSFRSKFSSSASSSSLWHKLLQRVKDECTWIYPTFRPKSNPKTPRRYSRRQ